LSDGNTPRNTTAGVGSFSRVAHRSTCRSMAGDDRVPANGGEARHLGPRQPSLRRSIIDGEEVEVASQAVVLDAVHGHHACAGGWGDPLAIGSGRGCHERKHTDFHRRMRIACAPRETTCLTQISMAVAATPTRGAACAQVGQARPQRLDGREGGVRGHVLVRASKDFAAPNATVSAVHLSCNAA
jgi:hypothetical protein